KPGSDVEVSYVRGGKKQTAQLKLLRRPLDLIRPEAENFLLHEPELPPDFEAHPSLELVLDRVGPALPDPEAMKAANEELTTGVWLAEQPDEQTLELRKTLRDLKLEVVKRFRLVKVPEQEIDNRE